MKDPDQGKGGHKRKAPDPMGISMTEIYLKFYNPQG